VEFEHPSDISLDSTIVLNEVSKGEFVGNFFDSIEGRRNVMVFPRDQNWRLVSSVDFSFSKFFIFGF
jgi:hypothetical protein